MLRSYLVQLKDTVKLAKQDGVVYRIPCESSKAYIGKTGDCETESKNMSETSNLPVPRPLLLQNMLTTLETTHFWTK